TPFVLSVLLMIVLFPLTIAYVIVVERAMDVRVAIRQGLQYLLASKGLTIIRLVLSAVVIVAVFVSFRDQRVSDARRLLLLSIGFLAVFLIRYLAAKLRTGIDRRFFREAYDAEQILVDLANKVRTIVETRPLLETVTHRISESLHIPRIAVLLNGNGSLRVAY